jgi:nitroreductase
MDVKKAIKERRSIRKYEDREIPDNLVRDVIDAARLAPSGNNTQPSTYYVIKDEETKAKLRANEVFTQNFVYDSPTIIVCCTNPQVYKKHVEGWDSRNEIRAIRDLSIASAFLVLRATELGLGTCYVGWLKEDKIKNILEIPEDNIVPYVITIGFPDEQPKPKTRKSIDEVLL